MVATRFSRFVLGAVLGAAVLVSALVNSVSADEWKDVTRALIKAFSAAPAASEAEFSATHKQTRLIEVLNEQESDQHGVRCFCLHKSGNLLAAVTASSGEIRVISPAGELLATWPIPISPEAINTTADGSVLVAGQGKLLRLDSDGSVVHEQDAPHIALMDENFELIREQVIEQRQRSIKSFQRQIDRYHDQVRKLKNISEEQWQELALLNAAIQETADRREGDLTDDERAEVKLRRALVASINRRVDAGIADEARSQLTAIQEQIAFFKQYIEKQGGADPTPEEIDEQVKATIQYKSRISSISAFGDEVFVATNAVKGYGYDVWRLSDTFEDANKIVTGLRGCCGQMDVQASDNGLYVAENGRHRVTHYDREGELLGEWGKRARSGVEGFGGCCNPMNVAFGADGTVYAAESSSGRIKRFSADGELLQLVGSVDLVPGCKNVSIAVAEGGNQVFMLDGTTLS